MIGAAAAIVWVGYGVASWGWCLVMGYDVPLTGWFSPFDPFTWPPDGNPGFVRKGQIFPGGAPGTASASTSTAGGNPANTPAAVGGANAANGAPASTPANPGTPPQPGTPSPGSGVIYPPGSQNI